jgi:hypothetical protein
MILRIRGTSMQPTLREGDWVEVAQGGACATGSVAGVRTGDGRLIIHRIIGTAEMPSGLRVITRGDNRERPDPPWVPEQIIGPVTRVIRPDGAFPVDRRITWQIQLRWCRLTLRYRLAKGWRRVVHLVGSG